MTKRSSGVLRLKFVLSSFDGCPCLVVMASAMALSHVRAASSRTSWSVFCRDAAWSVIDIEVRVRRELLNVLWSVELNVLWSICFAFPDRVTKAGDGHGAHQKSWPLIVVCCDGQCDREGVRVIPTYGFCTRPVRASDPEEAGLQRCCCCAAAARCCASLACSFSKSFFACAALAFAPSTLLLVWELIL